MYVGAGLLWSIGAFCQIVRFFFKFKLVRLLNFPIIKLKLKKRQIDINVSTNYKTGRVMYINFAFMDVQVMYYVVYKCETMAQTLHQFCRFYQKSGSFHMMRLN